MLEPLAVAGVRCGSVPVDWAEPQVGGSREALPGDCWQEPAQGAQALPLGDSPPDADSVAPQADDLRLDSAVRAQGAQATRRDGSLPDADSVVPKRVDSVPVPADFRGDLPPQGPQADLDATHSPAGRADLAGEHSREDVPWWQSRALPEAQLLRQGAPLPAGRALPLRFAPAAAPDGRRALAAVLQMALVVEAEFSSRLRCGSPRRQAGLLHGRP